MSHEDTKPRNRIAHLLLHFLKGCVISAVVGTLLTFVLHAISKNVIDRINWGVVFAAKNYDFGAVMYRAKDQFYEKTQYTSTFPDTQSLQYFSGPGAPKPETPKPFTVTIRRFSLWRLIRAPFLGPQQTILLLGDSLAAGGASFASMLLSLAVGFALISVALWKLRIVDAKTNTYIWVSVALWLAPFAGAAFLSAMLPLITATTHLFGHLSAAVTEFAMGIPLLKTLAEALKLNELGKKVLEAGAEGVHSHTEHEIASKVEKRLAKEG